MRHNNVEVINNSGGIALRKSKTDVVTVFKMLADKLLSDVQARHEFKNQTFNLEDSYGYAIYYDSDMVIQTLSIPKATVSKKIKGEQVRGYEAAKEFLDKYQSGRGYTLILVAGMKYANIVENYHGLDVLTGSFNLAMDEVEILFRNIPKSYYKSYE